MTVATSRPAMPRTVELSVTSKSAAADGVVAVTLAHPGGERLPDWTPGAHIDLVLPGGLTRQYSLCGDRWDPYSYRIGVLREPAGRGGSAYIHDELAVGAAVAVGGPRNNFALAPSPRYLFIAGGIGITPLLPMVEQAERVGADWRLLYGGRARRSMAFTDELGRYGGKVTLVPQDERGLPDLRAWLGGVAPDARVYCCGPGPLLEAVHAYCAGWPQGRLRTECFVPRYQGPPAGTRRSRCCSAARGGRSWSPRGSRFSRPSATPAWPCCRPAARGPAALARPRCWTASLSIATRSSTTLSAPRATACSSASPGPVLTA